MHVQQLGYELVEEPTKHQNSYVTLRDRENVLFVSTFQRKDGDFVTLTLFDHEEARVEVPVPPAGAASRLRALSKYRRFKSEVQQGSIDGMAE